jgi:hypothetical protein
MLRGGVAEGRKHCYKKLRWELGSPTFAANATKLALIYVVYKKQGTL